MIRLRFVFVLGACAVFAASWQDLAAQERPLRVASRSTSERNRREHPLENAIRVAQTARRRVLDAEDYKAVLTKREVVGRRMISKRYFVKVRHEPFSIYMRTMEPDTGCEVIYVDGRNEGNQLSHLTGMQRVLGTLRRPPTCPEAMAESRYPITKLGLEKHLQSFIDQWEYETAYGEIELEEYPDAQIGNQRCRVIEAGHPTPRRQFRYHKTRLYLDARSGMPVRFERLGFPPQSGERAPVVEQYTYTELRTDVGMTDYDFSTRNREYDF